MKEISCPLPGALIVELGDLPSLDIEKRSSDILVIMEHRSEIQREKEIRIAITNYYAMNEIGTECRWMGYAELSSCSGWDR